MKVTVKKTDLTKPRMQAYEYGRGVYIVDNTEGVMYRVSGRDGTITTVDNNQQYLAVIRTGTPIIGTITLCFGAGS